LLGQMIVEMGLSDATGTRSPNLAIGNYFSVQPTPGMASDLAAVPGAGIKVDPRVEEGGQKRTTISASFADPETMYRYQFERVFGIGKLKADGTHEVVTGVIPFASLGKLLVQNSLDVGDYAKKADDVGYAGQKTHKQTMPEPVAKVRTIVDMLRRK
jgi:hypothetical protein